MRKRLYKHTYSLGYNTRDNPTSLHFASAQKMENLKPNDPNPIPRDGATTWGNSEGTWDGTGVLLHIIPFTYEEANYSICISYYRSTTYIFLKYESSNVNVLIDSSADYDFHSLDVSWKRIRNMVFLSDGKSSVYILEPVTTTSPITFTIRNANIARPVSQLGQENLVVTGIFGTGNITSGKYINYSITFVHRVDADSMDGNGDPILVEYGTGVFNPGRLESVDQIDERKVILTTSDTTEVESQLISLLDTQVTHIRIYRTLESETEDGATGDDLRWIADVPAKGPNAVIVPSSFNTIIYNDGFSTTVLNGNLNLSKNVGFDPMPAGKTMTYHNGRLWVGAVDAAGEAIGRWYYSIPPRDVDYPEKWLSMFVYSSSYTIPGVGNLPEIIISGFKDTSQEDDDYAQIIAVSRNDIILINSRTVWFLPDGDPETFEPERIDGTNGTEFNHSLVEIDDNLYYLSRHGPVVIKGRIVEHLIDHTAGEVWPLRYNGSKGYFFDGIDPKTVKGFYFDESWFLATKNKVIGYYMPDSQKGLGPWELTSPLADFSAELVMTLVDDKLVFAAKDIVSPQFYEFLARGEKNDNGTDFQIGAKSKAMYINEKDREKFGEAAQLIFFIENTDQETLTLILTSDYFRFLQSYEYADYADSAILTPSDAEKVYRLDIQQPIQEGFVGHHFIVEWYKTYAEPYDFITKGFTLENIIRRGRAVDYISADNPNFSEGDIIETGVATLEYEETGVATTEIIEGGG